MTNRMALSESCIVAFRNHAAGVWPASSQLRRMLPHRAKRQTEIDPFRTVQVQSHHGSPARGRAALNEQSIIAPRKVTRPALAAWVEERHEATGLRVAGVGLRVFVAVARRAGPGQVCRGTAGASNARPD